MDIDSVLCFTSGLTHSHTHTLSPSLSSAFHLGEILFDDLKWESVTCAAHHLQNAIKDGLSSSGRLLEVLSAKARKLVGHFKHSALATNDSNNQLRAMGEKVKKVVQDCPTRWNSAYLMLERLVELRVAVSLVINRSKDHKHLDLTPSEWGMAKGVIDVLRTLEAVNTRLCSHM